MSQSGQSTGVWRVDAHVHLRAHAELAAIAPEIRQRLAGSAPAQGVAAFFLMLADTMGEDGVKSLLRTAGSPPWRGCSDEDVPIAIHDGNPGDLPVVAIAGYQIVTSENLEVLALASPRRLPDGLPLQTTLTRVLDDGGIPVLPWGVGKWLGRRARCISEVIHCGRFPGRLAFADNALRPRVWPFPRLLREAQSAGFPLLNGSDSLPLPGEQRRVGSAGIDVDGGDVEHPVAAIRCGLLHPLKCFGRPMGFSEFVRLQSSLRYARPCA